MSLCQYISRARHFKPVLRMSTQKSRKKSRITSQHRFIYCMCSFYEADFLCLIFDCKILVPSVRLLLSKKPLNKALISGELSFRGTLVMLESNRLYTIVINMQFNCVIISSSAAQRYREKGKRCHFRNSWLQEFADFSNQECFLLPIVTPDKTEIMCKSIYPLKTFWKLQVVQNSTIRMLAEDWLLGYINFATWHCFLFISCSV